MNRRDFLRPKQILGNAVRILGLEKQFLDLGSPQPETSPETSLVRFSRRAMATSFEVLLPVGVPSAAEASSAALDLIDKLEDQMTVYRETSEISRINRQGADSPQPIEGQLFELLELADHLTKETDGAF